MARTRLMEANEAVLAAADHWLTRNDERLAPVGTFEPGRDLWFEEEQALRVLRDLLRERREAIAAQSLDESEVYERNDAHRTEREAAARAMISRKGHRRLIYHLIEGAGRISDRGIENALRSYARNGWRELFGVPLPADGLPHQTLSSARKSLVDAGLVTKAGIEVVNGRRHILWRALPLPEVSNGEHG